MELKFHYRVPNRLPTHPILRQLRKNIIISKIRQFVHRLLHQIYVRSAVYLTLRLLALPVLNTAHNKIISEIILGTDAFNTSPTTQ